MKHLNTLLGLALAAGTFSLSVHAADVDTKFYGAQASAQSGGRVIDIVPGTRYVNVKDGETVTFRVGGQQFTWTFQMAHRDGVVALSAILPSELHAEGVTVYVAPDTSYL